MDNRLKLLEVAKQCLGKDLVPFEDTLACAGQVNAIYKKAFGREIGGGLSTYLMWEALKKDKRFLKVDAGLPGDIVISPTGFGDSKKIRNGHVGIVMEQGQIASNNSLNGLFELNYTFETWKRRWKDYGRYPMDYFRVVTPPVPAIPMQPAPIPMQPVVIPTAPSVSLPQWLVNFLNRDKLGNARSNTWPAFRKIYIKKNCECCGRPSKLLKPLQLHHKNPFHLHPELELDPDNVITLCDDCHLLLGHLGNFQSWNPTVDIDVPIWNKKVLNRP